MRNNLRRLLMNTSEKTFTITLTNTTNTERIVHLTSNDPSPSLYLKTMIIIEASVINFELPEYIDYASIKSMSIAPSSFTDTFVGAPASGTKSATKYYNQGTFSLFNDGTKKYIRLLTGEVVVGDDRISPEYADVNRFGTQVPLTLTITYVLNRSRIVTKTMSRYTTIDFRVKAGGLVGDNAPLNPTVVRGSKVVPLSSLDIPTGVGAQLVSASIDRNPISISVTAGGTSGLEFAYATVLAGVTSEGVILSWDGLENEQAGNPYGSVVTVSRQVLITYSYREYYYGTIQQS